MSVVPMGSWMHTSRPGTSTPLFRFGWNPFFIDTFGIGATRRSQLGPQGPGFQLQSPRLLRARLSPWFWLRCLPVLADLFATAACLCFGSHFRRWRSPPLSPYNASCCDFSGPGRLPVAGLARWPAFCGPGTPGADHTGPKQGSGHHAVPLLV